jgi:hypothetical protein
MLFELPGLFFDCPYAGSVVVGLGCKVNHYIPRHRFHAMHVEIGHHATHPIFPVAHLKEFERVLGERYLVVLSDLFLTLVALQQLRFCVAERVAIVGGEQGGDVSFASWTDMFDGPRKPRGGRMGRGQERRWRMRVNASGEV